ncbi:hypothetical protein BT96DRAFT_1027034 [Gymnopus androsaceus JB14]|uniref:Uncharacterized protein n=1 Tax=Gymnopus androsaceus JB14 TaxID=1447944 RepID=A0A6A4GEJ6_9AGAR|nr:hypothetical protein BT96DRAFT_1027034 [Gymnopus androsaceus JB14]
MSYNLQSHQRFSPIHCLQCFHSQLPSAFFSRSKRVSKTSAFEYKNRLSGHKGPVLCLSATDDGKLLASGGADGVRIWSLQTNGQLKGPTGAGTRGATTALTWISRTDDPDEALFYGTQSGALVCWKQRSAGRTETEEFEERFVLNMAQSSEITGIDFDADGGRLVVCNRNAVVQLLWTGPIDESVTAHAYRITGRALRPYSISNQPVTDSATPATNLSPLFSVTLDNIVPKSVAFGSKANDRKVIVFGLYDGAVVFLSHELGRIEGQPMAVGGPIGNAILDAGKGVFAIDDPAQGVGLYRMDCTRLRTFPVKVHKTWRPRQICFGEDCRSGEAVDELTVGRNEWVQTVLSSIVAANSKDTEEGTDIVVWRKRLGRRANMESESRLQVPFFLHATGHDCGDCGLHHPERDGIDSIGWVVQRQGA